MKSITIACCFQFVIGATLISSLLAQGIITESYETTDVVDVTEKEVQLSSSKAPSSSTQRSASVHGEVKGQRKVKFEYDIKAPGLGVATWKEISLISNEVNGYSERNGRSLSSAATTTTPTNSRFYTGLLTAIIVLYYN